MSRPLTIRQGDERHAALLDRLYGPARVRRYRRSGVSLTSNETRVPPMTRAARRLREERQRERTTLR